MIKYVSLAKLVVVKHFLTYSWSYKAYNRKDLINDKNVELFKLNNIVSYVPQKIILFEDTIKKNILFNKKDDDISNDFLKNA